jgi:hypothetical protein
MPNRSSLIFLFVSIACSGQSQGLEEPSPDAAADTVPQEDTGPPEDSDGAGGTPDAGETGSAPRILFEASYQWEYGSVRVLDGIYLTADGSVFAYDYYGGQDPSSFEPPPRALPRSSLEDLETRWGTVSGPIAHVPPEELEARYAQVEDLARGVLLHEMGFLDMAEISYVAYRYDATNERYSRVVLGVSGLFHIRNLVSGADELVAWLSTLQGKFPSTGWGQECVGATCTEPPPQCPWGVPSVHDGCWGACIRATSCLEVSDCSWCDAPSVCAASTTGSLHCSRRCGEDDACDCLYGPCAGGRDFCSLGLGGMVVCGAE